jgi:hypothetical protein
VRFGLPGRVRTAAAPTLPSCADPSEYTFTCSVAKRSSRTDASLLVEILTVKGSLPICAGFRGLDGIFSMCLVLKPVPLNRMCSGVLCLLIYLLLLLTGLYSGCPGGVVASRTAARWHHFSTVSIAGRRYAHASRVSVGEVRRAPVIAIAPLRCMLVSCLITFAEPLSFGPGCSLTGGPHQTSAPYRILGSATPMYSHRAYLGVMPQLGLATLLICDAHFVPFSIAYACCAFQLRC